MQKWEANFQDKQVIFNVSFWVNCLNTQVTKKSLEKFKLMELLKVISESKWKSPYLCVLLITH